MIIDHTKHITKGNKIVVEARITLENKTVHTLSFEVDRKFENYIARNANAFLPIGIAIGMKKNENLKISGEVSAKLSTNSSKIVEQFKQIDNSLNTTTIEVAKSLTTEKSGKRIGCFFSGGVDSFYTFLKNKKKVDSLIFVHGFDIKLKDEIFYQKVEKNIEKISKLENVELVLVKTNVREILELYYDWNKAHAFALASVAQLFSKGFNEIFASCGVPNVKAKHLFMNPKTDILWSSEGFKFHHFGCSADKIEKLRFLAKSSVAMENLRVCWENKLGLYNCSGCEKCFRNMLGLFATDSLDACKTFSHEINLELLKNLRLGFLEIKYFESIQDKLAEKGDKSEVMEALQKCLDNNKNPQFQVKQYRKFRDTIRFIDDKYNHNRLFWFLTRRALI